MNARNALIVGVGTFFTVAGAGLHAFLTSLKSTTIHEQTMEALSFLPDLASLLQHISSVINSAPEQFAKLDALPQLVKSFSPEAAEAMSQAPMKLADVVSGAIEYSDSKELLIVIVLGMTLTALYKQNNDIRILSRRVDQLEEQVNNRPGGP